ncbi:MAG TPA: winged helix-turn-helix domain-containing protein [Candidatus Acidoferrales bacterium]|nr:winged helix-turn-helix domain-containing protein [Candidatus Acidoferrales bacterium]
MPVPLYTFGPFTYDPSRRTLVRQNDSVALSERMAQLLLALIQANGGFVDKETIVARVWPDGAPNENNLFQHIYMLRTLLKEQSSERSLVIGARRRGYRLAVPVKVTLSGNHAPPPEVAQPAVASPPLTQPDGLGHYARGCYLVEQETATTLTDAVRQFDSSLRCDPGFVPALFGIARALDLQAEHAYMPASYALLHAKRAIMRVLEIDWSYAPAHALLAKISLSCDWNWLGASEELDAAIKLDPYSSFVRSLSVWLHFCRGDEDEALARARDAVGRDPSLVRTQLLLGRALFFSRRYEESATLLSALIDVGAGYHLARLYRAQVYVAEGRAPDAIADLNHLPAGRAEDLSYRLPLLARAYAICGEEQRAADLYAHLVEASHSDHVLQTNLAMVAVALGRLGDALHHLECGMALREPSVVMLNAVPWFRELAHLARYNDLLARIRRGEQPPECTRRRSVLSPAS